MLIYRDSSRVLTGAEWRAELTARLEAARADASAVLDALIFAGELEAALEDADSADAGVARELTTALARAWLAGHSADHAESLLASTLGYEQPLRLRRPEGYAYYALDPAAYARLVATIPHAGGDTRVIGVRSIGTSLSAVVQASLRLRGIKAERLTVRPGGHPWNRQLLLSAEQRQLLAPRGEGDVYLVIDEGPGLSGSTFLAVADALLDLGVPAASITMIGSHPVDSGQLLAPAAAQRWSRFNYQAIAGVTAPPGALDISYGNWRTLSPAGLTPCWLANERFKYLVGEAPDELRVIKFAGLASYGARARERAELLAEAHFTPELTEAPAGYIGQRWLSAQPSERYPRQQWLDRLADYIAFRARQFPARDASPAALEQMTRSNVHEALSRDLPSNFRLDVDCAVHADARMQPHEWILATNGPPLKVDAVDHGDDHLFPGPCDIAWDLAGAVIEWRLNRSERDYLLARYRQQSADDAHGRLHSYLIAYAACRLAWSEMAKLSSPPSEQTNLGQAADFYHQRLAEYLSAA